MRMPKVGTHTLAHSELIGMEFFDVTRLLVQVVTVVIKVRSKWGNGQGRGWDFQILVMGAASALAPAWGRP